MLVTVLILCNDMIKETKKSKLHTFFFHRTIIYTFTYICSLFTNYIKCHRRKYTQTTFLYEKKKIIKLVIWWRQHTLNY